MVNNKKIMEGAGGKIINMLLINFTNGSDVKNELSLSRTNFNKVKKKIEKLETSDFLTWSYIEGWGKNKRHRHKLNLNFITFLIKKELKVNFNEFEEYYLKLFFEELIQEMPINENVVEYFCNEIIKCIELKKLSKNHILEISDDYFYYEYYKKLFPDIIQYRKKIDGIIINKSPISSVNIFFNIKEQYKKNRKTTQNSTIKKSINDILEKFEKYSKRKKDKYYTKLYFLQIFMPESIILKISNVFYNNTINNLILESFYKDSMFIQKYYKKKNNVKNKQPIL